jgi:formylglycine-generating enzyme required for sulfatase activity
MVRQWATRNGYTFAHPGQEGHDGIDGMPPASGNNRVGRGGSCGASVENRSANCAVAYRKYFGSNDTISDLGFRVVCR